jgi:hypothetical protein
MHAHKTRKRNFTWLSRLTSFIIICFCIIIIIYIFIFFYVHVHVQVLQKINNFRIGSDPKNSNSDQKLLLAGVLAVSYRSLKGVPINNASLR